MFFLRLAILAIILAVTIGGAERWLTYQIHQPSIASGQIITIPQGAARVAISKKLNQAGVKHNFWIFRLEAWRRGDKFIPKAGEYALPAQVSLSGALDIFHQGKVIQHAFTIAEGLTTAEIIEAVTSDERFSGEITRIPSEGVLLPETYLFERGTKRNDFIKRLEAAQKNLFNELWQFRQAGLPYQTLSEAIILASIIEKETGLAEERRIIASVLVNRLRRGMRLQSDPTVLYAHAQEGLAIAKLTSQHLLLTSPWNTYRHKGLPPTPIANPGASSFKAAINPAETPYYYFVADGKGGHAFAKTLEEHNRNVSAWRKLKDKVR